MTTEPLSGTASDARPANAPAGRLLAIFGVVFGVAVTIANTIGVGILRTPGDVASKLPSPALFLSAWIAGGLYALLGANGIAELTAMTRMSGGYTVFVRRALGPFAGFVVGWSDWLSTCSSLAAVTIVIGEYSGVLFPALAGSEALIATAIVLAFTAVLARGARTAGTVQVATTLLKAIAFAVFIVACFLLAGRAEPSAASVPPPATPSGTALLVAFILAMQSVIFTYDGYAGVSYFAGEIREPGRDIPRSMFGGAATIILIYLLVNIGILRVLPIERLAGEPFAAGAAAARMFGPRGDTVLRAIVIASLLSTASAFLLIASRIFYGTSAGGLFPKGARVSRNGTPTVGLPMSALIAVGFILSGTFEQVLAVTAFFFVANYLLAFLSVFVLRRKEPDAPRPFRAVAHPWTTGFVLAGSTAFLIGSLVADTRNGLWSLGLLVVSWPVYRVLARRSGQTSSPG